MLDCCDDEPSFSIIAAPLEGDKSPSFFEKFGLSGARLHHFDATQSQAVHAFLKTPRLGGFYIRTPFLGVAHQTCHQLTRVAAQAGLVDTITCDSCGQRYGDFLLPEVLYKCLSRICATVAHKRVLILTDEQAPERAQSMAAALRCLNAQRVTLATPSAALQEGALSHYEVLINATAIGGFPLHLSLPIALLYFRKLELVIDLVEEPTRTTLILLAQRLGLKTLSGFELSVDLIRCAAQNLLGFLPREEVMHSIRDDIRLEALNIVLIGMPGCGKTTVGKVLAQRLMRRFIDIDALVAQRVGMHKSKIYLQHGESFFREQETRVIESLAMQQGLVISTGGGSCLRPCNRELLGLNGLFIWLKRPLSQLATADRPIAQARGLKALYEERSPIYEALADRTIDVTTIDETTDRILKETRRAPNCHDDSRKGLLNLCAHLSHAFKGRTAR